MDICLNLSQEETKKIKNTKKLAEFIWESGKDIEKISNGGISKMSDKDKAKMEARIMAKLKSGKKLTQKEMDYLRKNNPALYVHAMRIQRMAEAIEEKLKRARSKEEVNRIIIFSLSGISKNDPDREFICAAVNRISTEFHKSGVYEKLPDTVEDANRNNNDKKEMDLKNWSPLTEVYDSLPQFNVGA